MKLRGQGEAGYAMAALLVAMALMAVFMTVALPTWSQMARREKEAEYLFRANQIALAVGRCVARQACPGGRAPSLDYLVEQRFLRKRYIDPLTGKDFVAVLGNQAIGVGVQTGEAGLTAEQERRANAGRDDEDDEPSSLATGRSLATDTLRITEDDPNEDGVVGPLTGVTSSSTETALRMFKGQMTTYDQWAVTVQDVGLHLGGTSVGSRFATPSLGPAGGQAPRPGGPPTQGAPPSPGQGSGGFSFPRPSVPPSSGFPPPQ